MRLTNRTEPVVARTLPGVIAVAIASLAGCIPTLHPLDTPETRVSRSNLPGRWVSEDGKSTWTFREESGQQYQLTFADADGREANFTACLTEIDSKLFMNLTPEPPSWSKPKFYQAYWLPVHTFFRIRLQDDRIELASLQPRWLKDYVEEHPGAVAITTRDNTPILTSETAELRGFVRQTLSIEEAYSKPHTLLRRGDG